MQMLCDYQAKNKKGQARMIQSSKYNKLIPWFLALFTNSHCILHPYTLSHHLPNIERFHKLSRKGVVLVQLLVQPIVQP